MCQVFYATKETTWIYVEYTAMVRILACLNYFKYVSPFVFKSEIQRTTTSIEE